MPFILPKPPTLDELVAEYDLNKDEDLDNLAFAIEVFCWGTHEAERIRDFCERILGGTDYREQYIQAIRDEIAILSRKEKNN